MALSNKALVFTCVLMLTCITIGNGAEIDISCLKGFKDSMEDANNALSSWEFSNNTGEGFICRFVGIECWHPNENRVLNINLSDLGLKGILPLELENCTSMTGLNLTGNHLYGTLPTKISEILSYMTSLDLSSNNFSGHIPRDFANCSYLNVLKLDNNRFSGQIPLELGELNRLVEFNVANNSLFGQVPLFRNGNISVSYAGNPGLCGGPLPHCK